MTWLSPSYQVIITGTNQELPKREVTIFTHLFRQNISLMAAGIPDLLSAHHIVLRYNVNIPKKSHQELKNYKQPVSSGLCITHNFFILTLFIILKN